MKPYLVEPGSQVDLSQWDPGDEGDFHGEEARAKEQVMQMNKRLETLQEILYAEYSHKVLVVLQGMDTSGKDGTIRHVFEGVNPQGVRVANFKVPTPEELDYDFLWRVHKEVPGKGEMVIFNRSHYEDVLVVRVHKLIGPEECLRRFEQINAFEQLLTETGTTILKFFLYISPEEQKERLQARRDDPTKQWKFNVQDLQERKLWAEYMQAYAEALEHTSTAFAPWYVIPANHKWYRDVVISTILVRALEGLNLRYPPPSQDLSGVVIE